MNGQHLRQKEENGAKETWQWATRGSLKRETEFNHCSPGSSFTNKLQKNKDRKKCQHCGHKTVRIFSNDIGMAFGLGKCATIKMKRGKLVEMERVPLAEGNEISPLEEDGEYKYLGMLVADDFKHDKMRNIAKKEHFRKTTKV